MAAGRIASNPFEESGLQDLRLEIHKVLDMVSSSDVVADGQTFRLELMAELLKSCEDPDWDFFRHLGEGVCLGVDEPLPRTSAVFEEKGKWKLDADIGDGTLEAENYQSVDLHTEAVKELFKTEAEQGWMVELPEEEAKKTYGDRLVIASLGVVQEKTKIRVVHDGSNNVHVNHRIRVRDQLRCPGAGELKTIMQESKREGSRLFSILGDVSKAHRRIKIHPKDWGYQACKLTKGTVWLNKVGTYGIGSAAYWWGRAAAGFLVRLGYYLAGKIHEVELLLYADDFIWIARRKSGIAFLGEYLFLLLALGVPFRWDKFRGGTAVEWVGFWIDLWEGQIGISVKRAAWLVKWMRDRIQEGRSDMRDFTAVLGRLCFTMGPVEFLRPFIAPLFSWASAVGPRGSHLLPWSVLFLLSFLAKELEGEGRSSKIYEIRADLGLAFRADAKAEGHIVRVGGWECVGGRRASEARWFSIDLDRKNAPWAFARGEPFRTIASLEMFATLLCVVIFGEAWPWGAAGGLVLEGITDNLGNTFALTRLMSSKFPLVVLLAELACQMRQRGMELSLRWAPREQNEEADALTNEDFTAFDPGRRVVVDLQKIKWLVLDDMLAVSENIYEEVRRQREAKPRRVGSLQKAKGGSLRERDPW